MTVRLANNLDIPIMVEMSRQKRLSYEKAQPQFWKYKGPEAEIKQAKWFENLMSQDNYIILVAEINQKILGFIIGQLIEAPEVYDLAGFTILVDDFCVQNESEWLPIGSQLINKIKELGKHQNASQIVIVSGFHDDFKNKFLESKGLNVASQWYVDSIS